MHTVSTYGLPYPFHISHVVLNIMYIRMRACTHAHVHMNMHMHIHVYICVHFFLNKFVMCMCSGSVCVHIVYGVCGLMVKWPCFIVYK